LSHRIHANPEIRFEEEQSARWCAEALDGAGFGIDMGVADLSTAFVATAPSLNAVARPLQSVNTPPASSTATCSAAASHGERLPSAISSARPIATSR